MNKTTQKELINMALIEEISKSILDHAYKIYSDVYDANSSLSDKKIKQLVDKQVNKNILDKVIIPLIKELKYRS